MAKEFSPSSPSFTAARLYEKTSKTGNVYLTGRMGGVRVTALKSRELADDGTAIWSLVFADAGPYQPRGAVHSDGKVRGKDTAKADGEVLELTRTNSQDYEPSTDFDIDQSIAF